MTPNKNALPKPSSSLLETENKKLRMLSTHQSKLMKKLSKDWKKFNSNISGEMFDKI